MVNDYILSKYETKLLTLKINFLYTFLKDCPYGLFIFFCIDPAEKNYIYIIIFVFIINLIYYIQ